MRAARAAVVLLALVCALSDARDPVIDTELAKVHEEMAKEMGEYMPEDTAGDAVLDKELKAANKLTSKKLTASLRQKKSPGLGPTGDAVMDKELAAASKKSKAKLWKHYKVDQGGDKAVNTELAKLHAGFTSELNDKWLHEKKLRRRRR